MCGDQEEEPAQAAAPAGSSQAGVRQAGNQTVLKSAATTLVRSQWAGCLGLGAPSFFILLHTQFVAPLPNALLHVADCVLPQSFKSSDL